LKYDVLVLAFGSRANKNPRAHSDVEKVQATVSGLRQDSTGANALAHDLGGNM
jgi:hypothetical protein